MGLSPIHIVILALVAVLMLGGGRFSSMMSDVAKGVKTFKKDIADEEDTDNVALKTDARTEPSLAPNDDRDGRPVTAVRSRS